MAIINSTAIGSGVKSAGVLTYRRVRGRTVAASRITSNKSRTPAQILQRDAFKTMAYVSSISDTWINENFDKTKYGSSRNNFLKQNTLIMSGLKNREIYQGHDWKDISDLLKAGQELIMGSSKNKTDFLIETTDISQAATIIFNRPIVAGDIIKGMIYVSYSVDIMGRDVYQWGGWDAEYVIKEADIVGGNTVVKSITSMFGSYWLEFNKQGTNFVESITLAISHNGEPSTAKMVNLTPFHEVTV